MFEPDWLGIRDGVKLLGQSLQSQVNAMADYSRLLIDDEWMIKLLYTRIKTVMKRTHFCRKEQTSCYFFLSACAYSEGLLYIASGLSYVGDANQPYMRGELSVLVVPLLI